MVELYKHFSRDWAHLCDYSEEAQLDAYLFESQGVKPPTRERLNGYLMGKQWMGVSVSMWKEDLMSGLLFRKELYADPALPHWWLDQVLPPR